MAKCIERFDEAVKMDTFNVIAALLNFPGKTKLIAWFVSNCSARNKRWEYVQALRGFGIDVHIYGACGNYQCDR